MAEYFVLKSVSTANFCRAHCCVAVWLFFSVAFFSQNTTAQGYAEQIDLQIKTIASSISTDIALDSDARKQLAQLVEHRQQLAKLFQGDGLFKIANWQGRIESLIVDETTQFSRLKPIVKHQLIATNNVKTLIFLNVSQLNFLNEQVQISGLLVGDRIVVISSSILTLLDDDSSKTTSAVLVLPTTTSSASSPVASIVPTATVISSSSLVSVLPNCATTGEQKALVVAVNYIDDTTEIPTLQKISNRYFATQNSLAEYWQEVSYGKTSLVGDNLGWLTLDNTVTSTNACNMTNEIRQQAIDYAATQVDISQYTRLFIVMRQLGSGCSYVGQSTTQCGIFETSDQSQSARLSTHWVLGNVLDNDVTGLDLVIHEAGHNLGLNHSGRLSWGDKSTGPILDKEGSTFFEVGDIYDAMGGSSTPLHYNAQHKYQLGWLEPNDIVNVNGQGDYSIAPLSASIPEVKAIKLFRGADSAGNKEYFWLETKGSVGFDGLSHADGIGTIHIHQQSKSNDKYTYQIDANPATTTNTDAPIQQGDLLFDIFSGLSIEHMGIDGAGRVDVQISTLPSYVDTDEDGVIYSLELLAGSDPLIADTDGDGFSDKWEICADGDCSSYNAYPAGQDFNPANPDTDGDGMYDKWERNNGFNALDPADASLDADNDGVSNLNEFLAGTDPQGGDSDGDGLSDGLEISIGTDTMSTDTDNDGMDDGWEYNNGLDPLLNSDASLDSDQDTLDNLQEYNLGTNPNSQDSDGDTLLDQNELLFYGTDPALNDTDEDRINDFEELENGTDPLTISADTDGDGMNDDWENLRGTQVNVSDGADDPDNDGVVNIIEYLRYSLPRSIVSVPNLATWHVDVNSLEALEEGSLEYPFTRIDRGITAAQSGDTVLVASGLYNSDTEQLLSITKPIHVLGPADRSALIQGSGMVVGVGTPWVLVENLSVNYTGSMGVLGLNSQIVACNLSIANGLTAQSANKALFKNNVFNNTTGARNIYLMNASNVILENNTIVGAAIGIELSNTTATTLVNNIVVATNTLVGFTGIETIKFNFFSDAELAGEEGNYAFTAQFINALIGDFRLEKNSAGIAMGNPESDFSREPMPNGYRINLGAFGGTEFATMTTDVDSDNLPDSWESSFGLSTVLGNTFVDSDLDGFSDYHEYFAGSNPNNNLSIPNLSGIDDDMDGIDDAIDNCPQIANESQADNNGDGYGELCPPGVNIPLLSPWSVMALILAFIGVFKQYGTRKNSFKSI